MRRRALVVCPGRGTYNRDDLGYIGRYHGAKRALLTAFDEIRNRAGQPAVTALDAAPAFSPATHLRGDNASGLIFASSFGDFSDIDRAGYEVVAVTGNSMGWYTALACAGAVSPSDGFGIVNTMGTLMHRHMIGAQLLYPVVDEDWVASPDLRRTLVSAWHDVAARPGCALFLSIDLGGVLALAGNAAGIAALQAALPPVQGRYPMLLQGHAAFHTPLQLPVAAEGRAAITADEFGAPDVPLVDGNGRIWRPRETRARDLWDYTFGAQVTEPYDFALAIRTSVREFAPDAIIVLGPGTTLGGAIAQSLIAIGWRGLHSKSDFQTLQRDAPYLLSMALPAQRGIVTSVARR